MKYLKTYTVVFCVLISNLSCYHINERSDVEGDVFISIYPGWTSERADHIEIYLHKNAYYAGSPVYKMTKTDGIGRYYFHWLRKGTYSISGHYFRDSIEYRGFSIPFSVDGKFSKQNTRMNLVLTWN